MKKYIKPYIEDEIIEIEDIVANSPGEGGGAEVDDPDLEV